MPAPALWTAYSLRQAANSLREIRGEILSLRGRLEMLLGDLDRIEQHRADALSLLESAVAQIDPPGPNG
jgi:hypothetical protein